MPTLVETSDEEPTLAVARYLAELTLGPNQQSALVEMPAIVQYCGQAEAFLGQGNNGELVKLLVGSANVVFAKGAAEKDIEGVFAVIINLVQKMTKPEEVASAANQITTALTKDSDKTALRLRLLFNLYNAVKLAKVKYTVFTKAISLAAAGKTPELVVPFFRKLEGLVKEWGIGTEEQRALYLAVTTVLRDSKQSKDVKESFHYLVKYLSTFSSGDQQALASAKDAAARAAIEFVKAPDVFQCELLEMPAVQQLEKDTQLAPVYGLLKVFLTGKLGDYVAWHGKNKNALSQFGLSHEDSLAKMRLMSLTYLATESTSGEITYSQVQDTLQVSEDEVEEWIVRAIGQKLLEAKIDQLRQVIIINRCTQRIFGPAQWQELRDKVAAWRVNIDSISRIVQNARQSGGLPQGLQAGA